MIRSMTLVLCAVAGLTGCVPILIGGAAAGGYYIGQDERSAALASGDEIRVGACRFVLQAPGLKPRRVLTQEAVEPRRSFGRLARRVHRFRIQRSPEGELRACDVLHEEPSCLLVFRCAVHRNLPDPFV